MEKEIIVQLHGSFEKSAQKDTETELEFWFARDLQNLLGYSHWRSFESVIEKAKIACKNSGFDLQDHFAHARKMVNLGSGAQREIDDIALTRYACYLIAQNGDPHKAHKEARKKELNTKYQRLTTENLTFFQNFPFFSGFLVNILPLTYALCYREFEKLI